MNTNQPINEMKIEDYKHLDRILVGADIDISAKYKKGQVEHGGYLAKKGIATLIAPEIRAEAVDLIVYTDCLSDGLNKIRAYCAAGLIVEHVNDKQKLFNAILEILDGTEKDLK